MDIRVYATQTPMVFLIGDYYELTEGYLKNPMFITLSQQGPGLMPINPFCETVTNSAEPIPVKNLITLTGIKPESLKMLESAYVKQTTGIELSSNLNLVK